MAEEIADCSRAFLKLEAEHIEVLAWLGDWPLEALSFRSSTSTWSAGEVLDHIHRAESGTTADVRAGLTRLHLLGNEERPGIAALDRALRSDQTFQVPAGSAIHPDSQTTFSEATTRWQQSRIELRSLLEELTPSNVCCGVFCHPFAGWMTFQEVLEHFSAHLYHHRYQLERLQAKWAEQNS